VLVRVFPQGPSALPAGFGLWPVPGLWPVRLAVGALAAVGGCPVGGSAAGDVDTVTLRELLARLDVYHDHRDMWVGWYWDPERRRLYWCPVPTVVFRWQA
jgi:hypothetical protein